MKKQGLIVFFLCVIGQVFAGAVAPREEKDSLEEVDEDLIVFEDESEYDDWLEDDD